MKKELSFLNFADEAERRLVSRVLETAEKNAEREFCLPLFLNLREQSLVKTALCSVSSFCFTFYGGYRDSERRVLILFPEYLMFTALLEPGLVSSDTDDVEKLCREISKDTISAVKIKCSEFEKLSHRDCMGAVLALGTQRSSVGDIVVAGDHEAYVFASAKIAEFIADNLQTVGKAAVSAEKINIDGNLFLRRKTSEAVYVSSSLRFDCVISAVTGISRDKSKSLITSGNAELNYYSKASPDETVNEGDIISVRGYGKYKIADAQTKTAKGKIRLTVLKYI